MTVAERSAVLSGEGIWKRFRIKENRSVSELLRRHKGAREFWALQDVDLEVHPGEVLAVIGRNGAGKSTLLRACAGVSEPTKGVIRRPDRIAPLIEVGAGFHPELTGRENVFVNARLLGLGRDEVRRRFDEIVDFAELGAAIDRPVRQYSSGMFMRLGFSVAVHTDPELLIVDEVLAVGDLPFQVRCLNRIRDLREAGVGVLFVSHNLTAVLTLADRGMLLDGGAVRATGSAADVVGAYHEMLATAPLPSRPTDLPTGEQGGLAVEDVKIRTTSGRKKTLWHPGDRAVLSATLRATRETPEGVFGIRLHKEGGGLIGRWQTDNGPFVPAMKAGQTSKVRAEISLGVSQGGYTLDIGVVSRDWASALADVYSVVRIGVGFRHGHYGIVDLHGTATIDPPR